MLTPIPDRLKKAKYISLETFRKSGLGVRTPVWFAEENGKLYIFSNPESGKLSAFATIPK